MSAPLPNLSTTPSLHWKALIHLPFPFALQRRHNIKGQQFANYKNKVIPLKSSLWY